MRMLTAFDQDIEITVRPKRGKSKGGGRITVKPSLADDLRESVDELARWARGEKTGVVVHRVIPSEAKARRAAQVLGLIKRAPKVARRALKGRKAS